MPQQTYKTKWLARFTRREGIADADLLEAIERAELGLVDADLGSGLIKQRVARKGKGRSGGYRMIVAYRSGERAVFLYAFAKSDRENLTINELQDFREVGMKLLNAPSKEIAAALDDGALEEI